MDIKLLENKLSEIFNDVMDSRNAANAASDKYFKLKQWITEQEIKRLGGAK